jgi:hypothetical protein
LEKVTLYQILTSIVYLWNQNKTGKSQGLVQALLQQKWLAFILPWCR